MLTLVEVFGGQTEVPLNLLIGGSEDEPIQIKGIEGLEPVNAAVSTSLYGVITGEAITGSSVGKRNIVLTLGLNPDWAEQTIEELRKLLYRYFMPRLSALLRFTSTHLPTCQILGTVESIKPNIFSEDPEVQVSIICGRPDFVALEATTLSGRVDTDLDTIVEIDYQGSSATGMVATVKYSSSRITYTGDVTFHLETIEGTTDLTVADVLIDSTHPLELSSVPGNKFIRNQISHANLLNLMQSGYGWPILQPGRNLFSVVAELDGQRWDVSYFEAFGGL